MPDTLKDQAFEHLAIVATVANLSDEEWMRYLKSGVIRPPDTTAPGLEEAREKLKYYSMTPQERLAYDEHLNAVMIQNDV